VTSELGYVHGVSTERTYKSDRRIGSKSALSVVMAGIVMKYAIEMV
jgi:putative effector of murein hydrolase